MKIGIKARRRKNLLMNFLDTTFWSVQVNVYALLLLIKRKLALRSVDDLNCFTETSLVT